MVKGVVYSDGRYSRTWLFWMLQESGLRQLAEVQMAWHVPMKSKLSFCTIGEAAVIEPYI